MNEKNKNIKKENYIKDEQIGISLNQKKILLTKEGLEEKKERLKRLIEDERPMVLTELSEARKQGDLSENADYDAAKNRQAEVENEILELENLLTRIELIDNSLQKSNKILMGSNIRIMNLELNKEWNIKIVSPVEMDVENEDLLKIASNSPLAKSLLGKETKEEVTVKTEDKTYKVKILEVKN